MPQASLMTPAEAWATMRAGNQWFVRGEPAHPCQGVGRRRDAGGPAPAHGDLWVLGLTGGGRVLEKATRGPSLDKTPRSLFEETCGLL